MLPVNVTAVAAPRPFDVAQESHGLVLSLAAGAWKSAGAWAAVAATRRKLTDNATNYAEISAAGVISVNTSGFTALATPLYKVTTLRGEVTACEDWRGIPPASPFVIPTPAESIADATDAASAITQLNLLLAACRTYGIVAPLP